MSLDAFTDTSVATLLMLAKGAANADLEATAGEPVVVGAVGAPFDPQLLGMTKLPALFLYRQSASAREESEYDLNTYSTFILDYWAPVAGIDKIELRWPLLHAVWKSIAKAIQGGMHPDVSSGANVMAQANLRTELGNTTRVDYSRGQVEGGGWYPFFRASFRIYEDVANDVGVADVAGLPAFLYSHTTFTSPDATPTSPTHEHIVLLHGYAHDGVDPRALLTQGGQPLLTQDGQPLLIQGA